MDASILVLCANLHFTGVMVTFYRCFGRFTGFRDGQGVIADFFVFVNLFSVTIYFTIKPCINLSINVLYLLFNMYHRILIIQYMKRLYAHSNDQLDSKDESNWA